MDGDDVRALARLAVTGLLLTVMVVWCALLAGGAVGLGVLAYNATKGG